jgi:hypothetical protein
MSEPNPSEADPILQFLQAPRASEANDGFRQAVLEQTTRLLRRRHRLRRAGLLTALVACYAAGLLTVQLFAPRAAKESVITAPDPNPVPVVEVARSAPAATEVENNRSIPASTLERWALVRGEKRELYRLAGDRYLQEDSDAPSALRCYGRWLAAATPADLTLSADDNWLLMALKMDKQKEEAYAKSPQ